MFAPWLPQFQDGIPPLLILLVAFGVDALAGDPRALWSRLPHPVVLIGRLIGTLDGWLNNPGEENADRFRKGLAASLGTIGLCFVLGWVISLALREVGAGWLLEAVLASTLIAFRGLYDAVDAVRRGLGRSLEDGRRAVGQIVGRDPESLDAAAVARAGIESLAENFSDGVVAPLFWYAALGLPGLLAYKAVNTLDSMIGHRNERFEHFGKAAALIDDAANWLPARLSGLAICAAARLIDADAAYAAWTAMGRDAVKHRSPNAGWPEAAMAGALHLKLAGPRRYGDEIVDDDWMGDGNADATADDVARAMKLYLKVGALLALVMGLGAVLTI